MDHRINAGCYSHSKISYQELTIVVIELLYAGSRSIIRIGRDNVGLNVSHGFSHWLQGGGLNRILESICLKSVDGMKIPKHILHCTKNAIVSVAGTLDWI